MTDVPAAEHDPESPIDYARLDIFEPHEVSAEIAALSRKNEAVMLHAFNVETGTTLAKRMGFSDSVLSRWKSGALRFCALFLACAGLKVVPADAVVYIKPKEFN